MNNQIDRLVKGIHYLVNSATEKNADLKKIGNDIQHLFDGYFINNGEEIQHLTKEELYHFKQMVDAEIFDFSELHKFDDETFEFAVNVLKDLECCNEMKIEG